MSKAFDGLMRALLEVKAHQEGTLELPVTRIEIRAAEGAGAGHQKGSVPK